MFAATVNVPGYLPMADHPAVFGTVEEAWQYLSDELQRDGESAWQPDDPDDPDGPQSLTPLALALEAAARDGRVGTVYGDTPGHDTDCACGDLGLAYSVSIAEPDIYVCADCLTWAESGESDPDRDPSQPQPWSQAHGAYAYVSDEGFSRQPCDGCGSTLAGDRYGYVQVD